LNVRKLFRNKKAASGVIATVLLIGLTIAAVGIVYGILNSTLDFNSKVDTAGYVNAKDANNDGLIDTISLGLLNKGLRDAGIESVVVVQGDTTYLWYTLEREVALSTITEVNCYAIGFIDQIQAFQPFYVEITFDGEVYTSPGYVASLPNQVPAEVLDGIADEVDDGFHDYLVLRTAEDDAYGNRDFPAEQGYSPTYWFLLGAFEDDNKKPDLDFDYIDYSGFGTESDFTPYLLDGRIFDETGDQTDNKVLPYVDAGEHAGLIALNKYGKWDKQDYLDWGKYGVAYMWSYIYVDGDEAITCDIGANGGTEFKLWLNGDYLLTGTKKNNWYVEDGITLNPGLNLIMLKVSAKTDAHFAGQVLLFNAAINEQLASLYSVWPTVNDL